MNIFKKIKEFGKLKEKSVHTSATYRASDDEIKELAETLILYVGNSHTVLAPSYLKMYEETKDISLLKLWLNTSHLVLFGVNIISDKPIYKKCVGYLL